MASPDIKARKREDYPYMLDYRTRCFDSAVNAYLIEHCNLLPPTSKETPLAVHSHTDYISSIAYPAVAEVGVRVNKLGKSSVTYEVALFEKGVDGVKAVGEFVHVYIDRAKGRPTAAGMSDSLRKNLEKIKIGAPPLARAKL
ncbi:hypothetical protein K4F52_001258 [Lecanicillium sp. MT-2017a]|nr:hypothetical protein K4F52_001258 [Lecanicillium sp. MT-2017a]